MPDNQDEKKRKRRRRVGIIGALAFAALSFLSGWKAHDSVSGPAFDTKVDRIARQYGETAKDVKGKIENILKDAVEKKAGVEETVRRILATLPRDISLSPEQIEAIKKVVSDLLIDAGKDLTKDLLKELIKLAGLRIITIIYPPPAPTPSPASSVRLEPNLKIGSSNFISTVA